jgi:hypothetical protein
VNCGPHSLRRLRLEGQNRLVTIIESERPAHSRAYDRDVVATSVTNSDQALGGGTKLNYLPPSAGLRAAFVKDPGANDERGVLDQRVLRGLPWHAVPIERK